MAAHCKANNPNTCRVHGTNGQWDRLQRVADHAAKVGDFDLYSKAREEMDTLKDTVISDDAVEAAAAIYWTPAGWQKTSSDLKSMSRKNARKTLEIASPYLIQGRITNSAVMAVAKHSWESSGQGSWNQGKTHEKDEYMHRAQRLLKAAEPHLRLAAHSASV